MRALLVTICMVAAGLCALACAMGPDPEYRICFALAALFFVAVAISPDAPRRPAPVRIRLVENDELYLTTEQVLERERVRKEHQL